MAFSDILVKADIGLVSVKIAHVKVLRFPMDLSLKTSPCQTTGMSTPELWGAANIGDLEAVSELLAKTSPAQVNEQDRDGRTAVHRAVSGGHVAVAWQLLQAGADVTILDKRGRSALWDAVDCNSEVLVRMLTAWGGDPREKAEGQSLYQYANVGGKTEVSRALMEMTVSGLCFVVTKAE